MKVEALVPDTLWEEIRSLLPPPKPRRWKHPGRKPMDPRRALMGILYVLKSGIPRGTTSPGVGMWQRDELLAVSARLAAGRSMEGDPQTVVVQAARGQQD